MKHIICNLIKAALAALKQVQSTRPLTNACEWTNRTRMGAVSTQIVELTNSQLDPQCCTDPRPDYGNECAHVNSANGVAPEYSVNL